MCTLTGAGAKVVPIPDGRVGGDASLFPPHLLDLISQLKAKQNKQNRAYNIENLKLAKIIVSLPTAFSCVGGVCTHIHTCVQVHVPTSTEVRSQHKLSLLICTSSFETGSPSEYAV